jgi:DtxR family Mn-dependent transcriptional regulator
MYTPVVEDYLKAIWTLQQTETPVSTSRIAERLGLSPAAVTAMVKRLAEQNLLRHEPYYGVRLTPSGELAGIRIIRRHRVLELFLTDVLGYEWDRVHDEAERLEHAVSDQLVERMAAVLGNPSVDPHGDPIPDADGAIHEPASTPLSELPEGIVAELSRVHESDPERLRYIGSIGLQPGARIVVVDRQPFRGPITIEVDGRAHVIGHELGHVLHCVLAGDDA